MPLMTRPLWSGCCWVISRTLVLVPDECAEPHGFHDLLLEDLSSTEAFHVRPASAADLMKLKQRWPSSLLTGMTKCQVDMESLRRDYKREFGSGRTGDCPNCDLHINTNLSRHIMTFHLTLAQLWRCPIPWCSVWKPLRHQADVSGTKLTPLWWPASWENAFRPGL